MVKVSECAELLERLIRDFCAGSKAELDGVAEEIFEREREADKIKNRIRDHLSKSFFSAIDRSDALMVLREQDPIADECENVARLLVCRKTQVSESLVEPVTGLASKVVDTVSRSREVLAKLREVAESEPSKEDIQSLGRLADEVHECERWVETYLLRSMKAVFLCESEMDPLSVLVLVQMCERMAQVAHHAENSVEALQRLAMGRI